MAHQRGISADIVELGTKSMTDRISDKNRLLMKFTVNKFSSSTINGKLAYHIENDGELMVNQSGKRESFKSLFSNLSTLFCLILLSNPTRSSRTESIIFFLGDFLDFANQ